MFKLLINCFLFNIIYAIQIQERQKLLLLLKFEVLLGMLSAMDGSPFCHIIFISCDHVVTSPSKPHYMNSVNPACDNISIIVGFNCTITNAKQEILISQSQ